MVHVSDEVMRKTADVFLKNGLADVRFQYVGIDDCWMRTSPAMYASRNENTIKKHKGFNYVGIIGEVRDADGNILPNYKFPDMKAMTDYIHSYGLKVGLYSTPGPATCQNFAGSFKHEKQDAEQYAHWGFDLLKYDQCSGGRILNQLKKENPDYTDDQFWKPMADYLSQQDSDILFNLCQYGQEEPWTWAPGLGIQSWRIGGDVMNINQDELGHVAEVVRNTNEETVMVKKLADGSHVLAVFNRNDTEEMIIKVNWNEFLDSSKPKVYDVWRQKNIGTIKDGISVKLSPNGVGLFKVNQ
jgi:alpha-galactosidase